MNTNTVASNTEDDWHLPTGTLANLLNTLKMSMNRTLTQKLKMKLCVFRVGSSFAHTRTKWVFVSSSWRNFNIWFTGIVRGWSLSTNCGFTTAIKHKCKSGMWQRKISKNIRKFGSRNQWERSNCSDVSFIREVLRSSEWMKYFILWKWSIQELLGLPTSSSLSSSSSSFCSLLQCFFSLLLTVTDVTSNQFYFCVTICGM